MKIRYLSEFMASDPSVELASLKVPLLALKLSGRENVSLPVIDRFARFGWLDLAGERRAVDRILERVQVHPRALYRACSCVAKEDCINCRNSDSTRSGDTPRCEAVLRPRNITSRSRPKSRVARPVARLTAATCSLKA